MLDLNYVRENIDKVREALQARRADTSALDDFARADEERRRAIGESDQLNSQRNNLSKQVGALMKQGRSDEANNLRAQVTELKDRITQSDASRERAEERIQTILVSLPNIPHESVPRGESEADNVEVRRWGTPPSFDFEPKDHVDLGAALGILGCTVCDPERRGRATRTRPD
jgi:seryl-tRNA synthetase